MRRRMTAVAALFSVSIIHLVAQSGKVQTPAAKKWRQGLDARKDTIDRLMQRLKSAAEGADSNKPGAVPRPIACAVALETALGEAVIDAHFTSGANEDFHLIFNAPNKQYLDVSYTYNQRGFLLLTGIHKLPDRWRVGFQTGEANANKFLVLTDDKTGCIYEFDSSDPFASRAVAAERE